MAAINLAMMILVGSVFVVDLSDAYTCRSGQLLDGVPDPGATWQTGCTFCLKLKAEATAPASGSVASGPIGVGVTCWQCPTFGQNPFVAGILTTVNTATTVNGNSYFNLSLCADSYGEMDPDIGGRLSICTCCGDYCNNNYSQCMTANYTNLATIEAIGVNIATNLVQGKYNYLFSSATPRATSTSSLLTTTIALISSVTALLTVSIAVIGGTGGGFEEEAEKNKRRLKKQPSSSQLFQESAAAF